MLDSVPAFFAGSLERDQAMAGHISKPRPPISTRLYHFFTKRHQRDFKQLEMLLAKRDADNGEAKQQAKNEMREGRPPAAANEPDDIGRQGKAAQVVGTADYFLAKWPEHQQRQFETLQAKGDAYNGKAKC